MALDPMTTPGAAHAYTIDIDGNPIKVVGEISGLKKEMDVVESKWNTIDGKFFITKTPGRPKAGEFSFSTPIMADKAITDWFKHSLTGKVTSMRKGISVTITDYEGATVRSIKLKNAWIKSWEPSSLKPGDTNAMTEKVTVVYEDLEIE